MKYDYTHQHLEISFSLEQAAAFDRVLHDVRRDEPLEIHREVNGSFIGYKIFCRTSNGQRAANCFYRIGIDTYKAGILTSHQKRRILDKRVSPPMEKPGNSEIGDYNKSS